MALLKLSELLDAEKTIDAPRKLQTALFLAQSSTDCDMYRFRVSAGKVISDALDQDLAQLEASGWVSSSCSVTGKRLEIVIHPRSSTGERLSDDEVVLKERFNSFLGESVDVLEAAATMTYAEKKSRTKGLRRLRWLSSLDDAKLLKARDLCKATASRSTE